MPFDIAYYVKHKAQLKLSSLLMVLINLAKKESLNLGTLGLQLSVVINLLCERGTMNSHYSRRMSSVKRG